MLSETNAIILAAGKGSRMKSDTIKVLHQVAGKKILSYVLDAVQSCSPHIYVVVGYQAEQVQSAFRDLPITFINQHKQLGTGHAVQQVIPFLEKSTLKDTLILAGDCPLIKTSSLESLLTTHRNTNAAASILTTVMDNPTGYGRIIRSKDNHIEGIIEQKDCSPSQATISEINSGIYVFNTALLIENIANLQSNNNQQEYYLTDIIHILNQKGHTISGDIADDYTEIIGVNTRNDLAKINVSVYDSNNASHMEQGVTIIDPQSTFIDSDVSIGYDTIIHPFTILTGKTTIGNHCEIGPYSHLKNCSVLDNDVITHSITQTVNQNP
tara:strand:+ start:1449 stop:2423 length:975 start_codon:yes stop_codon:yes gene_type:complete